MTACAYSVAWDRLSKHTEILHLATSRVYIENLTFLALSQHKSGKVQNISSNKQFEQNHDFKHTCFMRGSPSTLLLPYDCDDDLFSCLLGTGTSISLPLCNFM